MTETARLLRLGLTESSRPVDDVLDRLRRKDAAEWLEGTVASGPLGSILLVGSPPTAGIALEAILAGKNECKSQLHHATDADTRNRAILNYFICVAAALIHHRQRICSKGRDELDPILLDLAEAAPEPWADWLGRAALVVEAA